MTSPPTSTRPPDAEAPLTPDSQQHGWLRLLPAAWMHYALPARLDRPTGSWLLFWPCAWSLALAGTLTGDWALLLCSALGSAGMTGAGRASKPIVYSNLATRGGGTQPPPLRDG